MEEQKRLYQIVTAHSPGMPIGAETPVTEVQSNPAHVLAGNVGQVLVWWNRQPKRPDERIVSITEVRPFAVA